MNRTMRATFAALGALALLFAAGCSSGAAAPPAADAPAVEAPADAAPADDVLATTGDDATEGPLNPPAWLVGEWDTDLPMEAVSVTNGNVTVSSGHLDFAFQMNSLGLDVTESTDGDTYLLDYTAGGIHFTYRFTPTGPDTMVKGISFDGAELVTNDYVRK